MAKATAKATETRVAKVCLIFGTRNSGKSYYFLNEFLPVYRAAHPQKKILVVDTLDHPKYRHIPTITIDMLPRWKRPSIYRLYGSNTDEMLKAVSKLENTLLVLEDASKYIPMDLPDWVKRWFLDTKQLGTDVLAMFHGFNWCPPKLCGIADIYTIFRTTSPQCRKEQIPNYEATMAAYLKVKNSKQQWPRETVLMY